MKNLLQNTTQLAQAIWAHYLSPQLASGAYAAVDATCGRGNDTVWLTAHCGRVYAFDIQSEAIASTREALQAAGIADARVLSQAQASQLAAGMRDVQVFHKRRCMTEYTRDLIRQRRLQLCLPLRSLRTAMQILRTMSANRSV